MTKEDFKKINDYTLQVSYKESSTWPETHIDRIFNFQARRLTEFFHISYRESASSQVTSDRYFSELPHLDEVKTMHDKLMELKGTPPAWDDIVNTLQKPKYPSPNGGIGR